MHTLMEDSWPEISSPSAADRRQVVVEELLRGQGFVRELIRGLLSADSNHHHDHHQSTRSAEDLLGKVLDSLNKTVSMMSCNESSQFGPSETLIESENSEDSCKSSLTHEDGRGRYKRRSSAETWSKVTSALADDGHAWRKYGQKSILNSDFPRSYFRCTHKFDQGCQATKQVQKISTDPPMYKTTYQTRHTCKTLFQSPPIVIDSLVEPAETSSFILSFDGSGEDNCCPYLREGPQSRVVVSTLKKLPSTDYLVSPNPTVLSSTPDSEHRNATSSSHFDVGFDDALMYDCYANSSGPWR
ncbi:WRKY DNA-binding transcription factor 70 [Punica granatum]|uniref:WRKY DNA-binding transcription factor 70 n=2 Tax=Punica granatum TaxID=22663 RepID=A0A6P8DDM6_PUNGR|nr:WRKY DNA-binding transcription factor 70 [Punica granatum]